MDAWVGSILAVGFDWAPRGWLPCDGRLLPIVQYQVLYAVIGVMYGGDGQSNFALPDLRGRVGVGVGSGPSLTPRAIGQKGGAEGASQVPPHSHGATGMTTLSGSVTGSVSLPVTANVNLPMTVTGAMLGTTEDGQQDTPFPDSMVANVQPGINVTKVYAKPATPATTTVNMAAMTSTGTLTGTITGTAAGSITLGLTGTTVPTAVTVQSNSGPALVNLMNPFAVVNYIICWQGLYPSRP